jgi:hypothetical protein
MGASLFSINGNLRSLFDRATLEEKRSQGYKNIEIGKPIIIRYLYFFLQHKKPEKKNKLMISTFVKATETKSAAAEAINLFDKEAVFDENKNLRITDFGADCYGHPLCYYSKSFLGESLYLTTKIMELDKVDPKVVSAIQKGVGTAASLPMFAEFLPYLAGASVGISIFQKLLDLFNQDDVIIKGHDLDLHFNLEHVRHLQSGRIVCIPGKEEAKFLTDGKYKLLPNNKLVEENSGKEYAETSYFVIQVDSKANKKLENFDHYAGAADLLSQTNRGGDPTEIISTVVELFKGYNDIAAMREIEDLSLDLDDEEVKKKIKALYKSMSNETRGLYKDRVKELTGS